jgi:hypothetical protein
MANASHWSKRAQSAHCTYKHYSTTDRHSPRESQEPTLPAFHSTPNPDPTSLLLFPLPPIDSRSLSPVKPVEALSLGNCF